MISILAHSARQTLRYSTIFAIVASCITDVLHKSFRSSHRDKASLPATPAQTPDPPITSMARLATRSAACAAESLHMAAFPCETQAVHLSGAPRCKPAAWQPQCPWSAASNWPEAEAESDGAQRNDQPKKTRASSRVGAPCNARKIGAAAAAASALARRRKMKLSWRARASGSPRASGCSKLRPRAAKQSPLGDRSG